MLVYSGVATSTLDTCHGYCAVLSACWVFKHSTIDSQSYRMQSESRSRAISALVQHARDTFEKRHEDTETAALVAPISPSPPALIQSVLESLSLSSGDVVVDLGCGDGRWLIAAALMAHCTCRGFDLNESLVVKGRRDADQSRVSPLVSLEKANIFQVSLAGATVIIVYLFREGLARMKTKLETESRPGVRVVSVGFQIRGWSTLSRVEIGGLNVYLYQVPERGVT